MGVCFGKSNADTPKGRSNRQRNKAVEQEMQDDNDSDTKVNKLLLLGAGESGKSTLFKQMMLIYGSGEFSEEERLAYKNVIFNNILVSIRVLIENVPDSNPDIEHELPVEAVEAINNASDDGEKIDTSVMKQVLTLWKTEAVQNAYKNRAKFQLHDSASYWFSDANFGRFSKDDYMPSEQDILRSRVRTTGIVENEFTIEENKFKMFDVGGQRNERKKWIHCFENVTAVLFVGVLSEYDLVLYEDEKQNRLEETLNLFDEITHSRWFKRTSIILFLNKKDIFLKKNQPDAFPLSKHCPIFMELMWDADYVEQYAKFGGIDNYEGGCEAIKEQFEAKLTAENDKKIYPHITCATDRNNVEAIFDGVKDIIVRNSLFDAGLLG